MEAAHTDLELREMWRCRSGLCMLISVLLPRREMGATAWPQCWGKGVHGSCSGGCQTWIALVTSVEGDDPAIGMLL